MKKIFIFLNLIIFLFLFSACNFEHKIKIYKTGYDYSKNSLYLDISFARKTKISSFSILNNGNKDIINDLKKLK